MLVSSGDSGDKSILILQSAAHVYVRQVRYVFSEVCLFDFKQNYTKRFT